MTEQPPADRADLRDRIAAALYDHTHPGWAIGYTDLDQDEQDTYLRRADAVLAVLPEPSAELRQAQAEAHQYRTALQGVARQNTDPTPPADRADVLREAADALDESDRLRDLTDDHMHDVHAAANELRRMADEEQPAEAPAARCASCDHKREFHDADGRCWFTVDHGVPESNLVCPCAPRRGHDEEQQPAAADSGEAQQQTDTETPVDEPRTEEQIVRDHVTSLHLIGEQLATIESWMWQHLFEVREAQAAVPAPVVQQPAAADTNEARPAPDPDCERCDGSGLDPDAYFVNGDVWTHAPCSECLPEDDEAAEARQDGARPC